jgi:hypothetical protein
MAGQGADTLRLSIGAGATIQVAARGNSITIYDGSAVDINVLAGNESVGRFLGIERGVTIDTSGDFTRLEITSATAQTVTVITSFGEVKDRRFALPGSALPVSGEVAVIGGGLAEVADGSAPVSVTAASTVALASANANRQQLFVRNTGSSAVYLRSDTATEESAIEVAGGQTVYVEITSAVYAYNPGGSAVEVQVSEVS